MPAQSPAQVVPCPRSARGAGARLAICFPTYNRCELIAESLQELIGPARKHRIPSTSPTTAPTTRRAVIGSIDHLPKNNWQPRAPEIFVGKWLVDVMSLPAGYSYDSKMKLLRAHTENTRLFSFKNLLHMKSVEAITLPIVRQYSRELPYGVRPREDRLTLCLPAHAGVIGPADEADQSARTRVPRNLRSGMRKPMRGAEACRLSSGDLSEPGQHGGGGE